MKIKRFNSDTEKKKCLKFIEANRRNIFAITSASGFQGDIYWDIFVSDEVTK